MDGELKKPFKKEVIPFYYELEMYIHEIIERRVWKPGDFVPTERELCSEFSISRITVRRAIENLVDKGLLKKIKGRGTIIVGDQSKDRFLDQTFSFYKYLTSKGYSVKSKILTFQKILPMDIERKRLCLEKGEKIFSIKRVRLINNEPWYFDIINLAEKFCKGLSINDFDNTSLFRILEEKYNIKPYKTRRYLYAVSATKEEANLLDIKVGTPIQIFENINYMEDGIPSEHSINYCRSDKIIFEIEITKDNGLQAMRIENDVELGRR